MKETILAIECSSELCSVALSVPLAEGQGSELFVREQHAPREHAYLVLPFVEQVLREACLAYSDLSCIGFGRGPGAFTGLRVAASMAQGLALATERPLRVACSLTALARQLQRRMILEEGARICATLDARMSELYWLRFELREGELLVLEEARLGSPQALMASLDVPHYLLGPGCSYVASALTEQHCLNLETLEEEAKCFPHARDLLPALEKGAAELLDGTEAMPLYLRNNVAAVKKQSV